MAKPKFQKVSLDTPTFDKVGQFAKAIGLTKSGFVRLLILRYEAEWRNQSEEASVDIATVAELQQFLDPVVTVKGGAPLTMADLPMVKRILTKLAMLLGITIDTDRWARWLIGRAGR